MLIDLHWARMALQGVATSIDENRFLRADLTRAQATRFSVQDAVNRIGTRAFELMEGMAFMSSEEAAYLLVATRVLGSSRLPGRQQCIPV